MAKVIKIPGTKPESVILPYLRQMDKARAKKVIEKYRKTKKKII